MVIVMMMAMMANDGAVGCMNAPASRPHQGTCAMRP